MTYFRAHILGALKSETMKTIIIISSIATCAFLNSCGSAGLDGSLPIPFSEPAVDLKADIEVTPLPPRLCVGLDIIPRPEPEPAE